MEGIVALAAAYLGMVGIVRLWQVFRYFVESF